jgi:hypothetical protein
MHSAFPINLSLLSPPPGLIIPAVGPCPPLGKGHLSRTRARGLTDGAWCHLSRRRSAGSKLLGAGRGAIRVCALAPALRLRMHDRRGGQHSQRLLRPRLQEERRGDPILARLGDGRAYAVRQGAERAVAQPLEQIADENCSQPAAPGNLKKTREKSLDAVPPDPHERKSEGRTDQCHTVWHGSRSPARAHARTSSTRPLARPERSGYSRALGDGHPRALVHHRPRRVNSTFAGLRVSGVPYVLHGYSGATASVS